jgi:hypothetical protein
MCGVGKIVKIDMSIIYTYSCKGKFGNLLVQFRRIPTNSLM